MSLVDSLLAAIIREAGESLVLHVGERPVVVKDGEHIEVTSGVLGLDAMDAMLRDLLTLEAQQELLECGAVEAAIAPAPSAPGERFTVVAARGGDDIWIEIRRDGATARVAPPPARTDAPPEPPPPVVLSLAKGPLKPAASVGRARPPARLGGLERLLRAAAARGAESLHLSSNGRPAVRVDGDLVLLEGEPALTPAEVETLLLDAGSEPLAGGLPASGSEWIWEVPEVGRVRCLLFRDYRGPGGVFRLIPARPVSAEQLGLSREIQSLAAEPEGLVLVAGPRSSGKSTLVAAFVDLVNRTRSAEVVTLEREIKVVHDNRASLVSQREIRGNGGQMLGALRAAIRENPDVIVIEDLSAPDVTALALEAASAGHLVVAGVPAHGARAAVERLIEQAPAEHRAAVQGLLAETLRGVVAQVLLRKSGGGRVAAREVLLNAAAVAALIAEGRTAQLPMAIDSGRRHGMVPLNDALVAFVQSGAVDVREAYRKAADRPGLVAQLKREGIDTSFAERLA